MTRSTGSSTATARDETSQAILAAIGGPQNITQAWHCITRLRFDVADRSVVDLQAIVGAGVAGAQFSGDQLQVIVGTDVAAQFASLARLLPDSVVGGADASTSAVTGATTTLPKRGRFAPRRLINLLFETLSGIFTPILPAIVGAGLLKGLIALAAQLGWLVEGTDAHQVLSLIADGAFYFLPFLVAASSARRFSVDMSLALAVPAALLYPTIVNGAAAIAEGGPSSLSLFGLAIPFVSYSSSVVPAILGVYVLGKLHALVGRLIPAALRIVVVPVLTLLVAIPVTLVVLAPLGHYLGVYLSDGANWLMDNGGLFAGILLGGLMPLIVITGMHYAFFPTTFQSLSTRGYDLILLPFNVVANLATVGATLAVAIRVRSLRALAISTAFPASLGITEPAIFGVTLRLKRPFFFTLIGGAVGGAYAGLFALKSYGFAVPGLASLPLYVNPDDPANIVHAFVAIGISFAVAFTLTILFVRPPAEVVPAAGATTSHATGASVLRSPVSGRVIPLASVPDDTFASGLLGPGIALLPTEGVVTAPADGIVEVLTPTAHAVALTTDDGVEVLIHVGIDTVRLPQGTFTAHVTQGDRVTAGQPLITFDPARIESAGVSLATPVVVTNAALLGGVSPLVAAGDVVVPAGEPVLAIEAPESVSSKEN